MTEQRRHEIVWQALYGAMHPVVKNLFHLTHDELRLDGPCLLVSNHVSAWDPLLVAMSLRHKQLYFVASEHLFRMGAVSRALEYLVAPIPRRKASSGFETVKICLQRLKDGQSVCLFAEGEQCWDGRSRPVFPATGKLVKRSGASLVTYRLEGAYLSLPRWGRGIRRGRVRGGVVNVYSPEALRGMTPEQINAAIDRDIFEDAWQRQKQSPVRYRGKRNSRGSGAGALSLPCLPADGRADREGRQALLCLRLALALHGIGFFDPPEPFADLADWEDWQREALCALDFVREEGRSSPTGGWCSRAYSPATRRAPPGGLADGLFCRQSSTVEHHHSAGSHRRRHAAGQLPAPAPRLHPQEPDAHRGAGGLSAAGAEIHRSRAHRRGRDGNAGLPRHRPGLYRHEPARARGKGERRRRSDRAQIRRGHRQHLHGAGRDGAAHHAAAGLYLHARPVQGGGPAAADGLRPGARPGQQHRLEL